MIDLELKYETMIRKVFQCGRSDDPLGKLADTDDWYMNPDHFSKEHSFKAWAVLSRIQLRYLDSVAGREDLHDEVLKLEQEIFDATTNEEVTKVMDRLTEMVDGLNLSEFPHIDYYPSNDKR